MYLFLHVAARGCAEVAFAPEGAVNLVVDDTGIEPVTPSMSTKQDAGRTASGPHAIKGVGHVIKGF